MLNKDLNGQPKGSPPETLNQIQSRISKRNWKHVLAAGTIGAATIFGVVKGGQEVSESRLFSLKETRQDRLAFGMLWLLGSSVLGGVGAAAMLPRLSRNQRSLERIEVSKQAGCVKRVLPTRSPYKRSKDGLMETFGEAADRIKGKLTREFAGAVSCAVAGVGLVLDAAFATQPILSKAILPVLQHVDVATTLGAIGEGVLGSASLGVAVAFTVARARHKGMLATVEDDIRHEGRDGRYKPPSRRVKNAVVEPVAEAKLG